MRKRLFIYTTLIILFGLLCFFGATVYSTYANNLRIAGDAVTDTANVFAALYSEDIDLDILVNAGGDTRITVISSGGTVLADSSPIDLTAAGTHLDRQEIQAAANGTPETFMRYSSTLGMYFIYYALMIDIDGGNDHIFIRTSYPIARLDAYYSRILPFLIIVFIIITALCFTLSRVMVKQITKPLESVRHKLNMLSAGEHIFTGLSGNYEEIEAIVSEIDDVSRILQRNMKDLQNERDKAGYILDNICDAIFAVDPSSDIALINNSAMRVFGTTSGIIGKNINYLTYNRDLLDAVGECSAGGKISVSELSMNGRTYTLTVMHLEGSSLTIVILSDITETRESARRREEFFENASHELKTPLTAIKGFNELCAINNKDDAIAKYIISIERETDRMLTLIGDMLKLSELSNTRELRPVPVSLLETALQIRETLASSIAEKNLDFEISGSCDVCAEPEHIFELLKNLIENAVRYNTQGGSVRVRLAGSSMTVSDTGIGIPYSAQPRLFERFYRVEKSRSIRSGGTGLGLSIVKHICSLYNWTVSLKSKPGAGTDVTVVF